MNQNIFICQAESEGVLIDCVTLLSPGTFFSCDSCPEAVIGVLSHSIESIERITPDVFSCNSVFVDFMHEVIARRFPDDLDFQAAARQQDEGYVYIIDKRTPDPGGTVPLEDIIGAFKVVGGVADAASYWRNPDYEIFSSSHGFFNLGGNLHKLLLDEVMTRYRQN